MIHSKNSLFVLLAAFALLSSCSHRDEIESGVAQGVEAPQDNANVKFQFIANASSSKTRSTAEESDDQPVRGEENEYQVNNARVYLYASSTKQFVKSVELSGITRRPLTADNKNIIYDTERISLPSGIYDVFVIANYDKVINKEKEDEFLATVDSVTYQSGLIKNISKGIVMTNRAADNYGVTIVEDQNHNDNVINIYLERTLARIDVKKEKEVIELQDESTPKQTYATVTLDRYYIVNLPRYFNMFRRTAVLTSLNEPTSWSVTENFGKINDQNGFVIDPYFFKKTVDATQFTNGDDYYVNYFGDYNKETVAWETLTTQATTSYSLENCMFTPAQKNGYSTGVIFSARFAPNNNVYDLVGGTLQLVTDETKYPETLYYYNYKFYASDVALAEATKNNTDLEKYQARKFTKTAEGYRCYYVYWIRHLDNNLPTVMGVMEFGIVRNNLYLINVQDVFGLGYNELIPNPDTPDEGETSLNVILRVKPWIVRRQDIIL
jgi:hypothetical protein